MMNLRGLRSLSTAGAFTLTSFLSCFVSADVQQPYEGSLIQSQFSLDPFADADKLTLVLDRTLQLAGCDVRNDSFSSTGGDLECYYCHLSSDVWEAQRKDPSQLPSFRDMLGESINCGDHAYVFSLKEIADKARKYDIENNLTNAKVKGVILTQPSAGSSVLMNAIIVGEGSKSHTFADHDAIIGLMDACHELGEDQCMFDEQVSAMVNVIYMLSRTRKSDDESNIYIKLNPDSSANINVMREALKGQDVKWAYVQRDADEVLTKAMERKRNGCLKKRNNPSTGLLSYVQGLGYDDLKEFTNEEVCSAFFAHNHQTAINELSSEDPNTIFLDYETSIKDKDQLISLLQDFFDIDVNDKFVYSKVTEQVQKETHTRGGSRKRSPWVDEIPRTEITDLVKSANTKFLKNIVQL